MSIANGIIFIFDTIKPHKHPHVIMLCHRGLLKSLDLEWIRLLSGLSLFFLDFCDTTWTSMWRGGSRLSRNGGQVTSVTVTT